MLDIVPVTASDEDDNKIWIDIEVADDGSLVISDYSRGFAADQCFYKGADVTTELRIPPASVKALGDRIGIVDGARALAEWLSLIYQGHLDALRLIQRQCAELDLDYSEHRWP